MRATKPEDTIVMERLPDALGVGNTTLPDNGPDAITDRPDSDDAEARMPPDDHPLRRMPVLF